MVQAAARPRGGGAWRAIFPRPRAHPGWTMAAPVVCKSRRKSAPARILKIVFNAENAETAGTITQSASHQIPESPIA